MTKKTLVFMVMVAVSVVVILSLLLRKYLDEFKSLKKTLIAYNARPTWVRKRKGIPKETRIYIRRVINYYHIYKKEI